MTIEERARAKHINSMAKDFFCAMISNAHYWDIHDVRHYSTSVTESIEECFIMAEAFAKKELKTR